MIRFYKTKFKFVSSASRLMLRSALFLGLYTLVSTQVFGQMGYCYTYSDSCTDFTYHFGSGVTEIDYNTYGHQARVDTTLRSPRGRVAFASSGYVSASSTSVGVYLLWDDDDVGDYFTDSHHWYYCPIAGAAVDLGSTGAYRTRGFSVNCYNNVSNQGASYLYERLAYCPVKCPTDEHFWSAVNKPHAKVYRRWNTFQGATLCDGLYRPTVYEDCSFCGEIF